MCGYVRHLIAAGLAGLGTTSITGSDAWGAVAALAAVGATFLVTRAWPGRFAPNACSWDS